MSDGGPNTMDTSTECEWCGRSISEWSRELVGESGCLFCRVGLMSNPGGATLLPQCVVAGYKYRSHYRKSTHSRKDSHCTELKPATTGIAQYRIDLLQCLTGLFAAESHKLTVSGRKEGSAGAETRRVSPSDTMHANTHDRSTEMFETGEERLRPTDVQHPRTWERAIESLKRQISQGKTGTSSTSRVEPFLPNYRHSVLFSLMSSFRDVGCYPGRIGRKGSALRNREVERVGVRILRPGALDVNRTRLDVTQRCHR